MMFVEIEPTSPIPIYTQLINQIKKAIVKGELETGEMLPSVRSLAGDLGVNMHTVNKGYNLLVDEGVLVKSQRGYMEEITNEMPPTMNERIKAAELLGKRYAMWTDKQQVEDVTPVFVNDVSEDD